MNADNHICFLSIDDNYEKMLNIKNMLEISCDKLKFDLAFTMRDGLALYGKYEYSLIVLNTSLCKDSTHQILSSLRKSTKAFIVAIIQEFNKQDIVSCYDNGAELVLSEKMDPDIYVSIFKSYYRRFSFWEHQDRSTRFSVMFFQERLAINLGSREVYVDDVSVNLTAKEYALLSYLARNADLVLTIEQIVEEVWKHADVYSGVVTSVMSRLRRKIEPNTRKPLFIQTVYGVGYRLCSNPVETCDD